MAIQWMAQDSSMPTHRGSSFRRTVECIWECPRESERPTCSARVQSPRQSIVMGDAGALRAALMASALVCLAPGSSSGVQQPSRQPVHVAVVSDGPLERYREVPADLRQEVSYLLSPDFDVTFAPDQQFTGDWTLTGARRALDDALGDPGVDLVIAIGPISSHLLVARVSVPKPAIAAFVLAPRLQGLPSREPTGITNLNYLYATREGSNLELLDSVSAYRRLALLLPRGLTDAIPDVLQRMRTLPQAAGVEVDVVPVGESAAEALAAIDPNVQAVVVFPLLHIDEVEYHALVQGLIARRLPSLSWLGEREVRTGLLAGGTPVGFQRQFLRRIALNVQQIALGIDAGELPVSFPAPEQLTINVATADAIGLSPRWSVLVTAELVGRDAQQTGRRLSLERAVTEAVDVNLELAASERFVAAGADNVRLATAPLLPQVGLTANWTAIDEDRASAQQGAIPQRSFSGGATISQLLYDERIWAGRSIEKSVQESRRFDRETLRLDIAREAGVAYLTVLRAKTFERIERDNLTVTKTNLELARLRVSTGAASQAEVHRWRAQVANNQQAVVDAEVRRSIAKLEVNRILHRPLEEPFETEEATLTDPAPLGGAGQLDQIRPYIDNPRDFELFRRFMTEEALPVAPELRQIDALTTAQERRLQSATRSFYLPRAALQADLDNRFAQSGIGSDPSAGPQLNDFSWRAELVFSYPLFTGTARAATRDQAAKELTRLRLHRDAAVERIEQRVRASLHQLRGSLINIALSRIAADAAGNNFRLTQDAYRRGVGDILDVLDAQNEALIGNESAASAVYDFLIDLMEVQRAAGRFEYFSSPADRESFLARLEAFFARARSQN